MRFLSIFLALGVFLNAFGGTEEDIRISFWTKGPDCYADGTTVMDGECYALVWSKDGNFDGFSADGKCIDVLDRIVLLAPVAQDGRCPRVLFQVPAEEASQLSGGFYDVYLLDTRVVSNGKTKVAACQNGRLVLMNGYGKASDSSAIESSASAAVKEKEPSALGGQVASVVSPAASDCIQPKIKSMRIEGDSVFLTVENLGGFMRVSSGDKVSASQAATPAVETSGGSEDVVLVARKKGASGFFKVIRSGK